MDAFTTSDNRARGRAAKPEKVGVLSEWGHNSPHSLGWALDTGYRPSHPTCPWPWEAEDFRSM